MTDKHFTYCSFAEPGKFLGGLFLPGNLNAVQASQLAWSMNLNPGGELLCCAVALKDEREQKILEQYTGRLLSKTELTELDAQMAPLSCAESGCDGSN
jgi:hypothetical protein